MAIYSVSQESEKMYDSQGREILDIYDPTDKVVWSKLSSVSGSLPLAFSSRAAHTLTDYRIYGTAEGAGVQTENLISKDTFLGNYTITQYYSGIVVMAFDVEPNTKYWLKSNYYSPDYATWYITNAIEAGVLNGNTNGVRSEGMPRSATSDSNGKLYVWGRIISTGTDTKIVQDMTDSDYIMLVKSDTAPTSYIPYGYEIPLTVTSGAQSQDYVLYIGDSQLGENEYLDYAEQKVYKRTEDLWNGMSTVNIPDGIGTRLGIYVEPGKKYAIINSTNRSIYRGANDFHSRIKACDAGQSVVCDIAADISNAGFYLEGAELTYEGQITIIQSDTVPSAHIPYLQPTDPPVALPELSTYQGENTLSSTETVGEVTIKGRIKEIPSS